jgi:hypothetical protein
LKMTGCGAGSWDFTTLHTVHPGWEGRECRQIVWLLLFSSELTT